MYNFLANLSTPIDILVNNAGILKVGLYNELSSDDFQEILQINVIAPFRIYEAEEIWKNNKH